jgi:thiosulfate dehydrogenase
MQQGDTYASFTDRDYKIWKNETDNFVAEGKKIFHSDKELGGTIGVSCDMCHPDASNTHPETYPKYQVQLQKVALLRDMIDWCIENPVKGKAFDPNDPKLRALEAYILAQRKGVPLDYGKH